MATVTAVGPRLGIAPTCAALGLPRATYYRWQRPAPGRPPRAGSPRALRPDEQAAVLAVLHEPRFVDLAPAEVYATLLDEGRYLCSDRTMYRLWRQHHEVRERRNSSGTRATRPRNSWPADPNELWSWDITKLLGPAKWTYFYLYVILDVFSRYVVGWMVAHRESATLAERLIRETCARQGIVPRAADDPRGSGAGDDLQAGRPAAGRSGRDQDPWPAARLERQPVLGSAVQDPEVPAGLPGAVRFDPGRARALHDFFHWYNTEHHHSGLGLLTPHDVHYGHAPQRVAARATVLATAYAAHPERFPRGQPHPPARPTEVWINPPTTRATQEALH